MFDLSLFRRPRSSAVDRRLRAVRVDVRDVPVPDALHPEPLGYSALEAGLRFLPMTLLSFFVAPISGKLAERLGVRWFIGVGLARRRRRRCSCAASDPDGDWTALLPGFIVAASASA